MSFTHFELEFTRDGDVFSPEQLNTILAALPQFTDVIIISHGWNNDMREARELYDALFASIGRLLERNPSSALSGRRFGVVRIFWPSKKFADESLIPGGGAASIERQDQTLSQLLERLKEDPERLPRNHGSKGHASTSSRRAKALARAQSLIAQLETDAHAREQFVKELRSVVDRQISQADDGSDAFFQDPPEVLFNNLASLGRPDDAPASDGAISPHQGNVGVRDGDMMGGAVGIGDIGTRMKEAALNLARIATYSQMKQRAGLVGRNGVGPLIRQIRKLAPEIKVHLVGHSFGGRLVTAAADSLPTGTKGVSVSLLQAAFSHYGLTTKFDDEHDGEFKAILAERRVSGPIVITHTKNDRAVGLAYPIASRFTNDKASALGDENDPFGGMGRNGAQKLKALAQQAELLNADTQYDFKPGNVYNLRADTAITDHGDVANEKVARVVLEAIRSTV